jgi:hypothetical protein
MSKIYIKFFLFLILIKSVILFIFKGSFDEYQIKTRKVLQWGNIVEILFLKNLAILSIFGDISTFDDMGTEFCFVQN